MRDRRSGAARAEQNDSAHVIPDVRAPLMVTLALATTGLGVLLPALRDSGQLDSVYGRLLLAAGTVGELGPIVLVSLLLSQRYGTAEEFGATCAFLCSQHAGFIVGQNILLDGGAINTTL